MRALSVRPHYAWAIMLGIKPVEHRSWRPSPKALQVGEDFAIHASSYAFDDEDRDVILKAYGRLPPETLDTGAILGVVTLTRVTGKRGEVCDWYLTNPRPLDQSSGHWDCAGRLGLWTVEPEMARRIKATMHVACEA